MIGGDVEMNKRVASLDRMRRTGPSRFVDHAIKREETVPYVGCLEVGDLDIHPSAQERWICLPRSS